MLLLFVEFKNFSSEVRAVHAFWYYMLIDNWGNVPITTDFTGNSKPATKPKAEVYNFIVSELNAVKDKLRGDVGLASYGNRTKEHKPGWPKIYELPNTET